MPKEYNRDQFWKLFQNLPTDLQDAILSETTADSIYDICSHNDIKETSKLAKFVGRVLLGTLDPSDLQETLKKELNFSSEKAEKVNKEIDRFIFYPVKSSLASLHETTTVHAETQAKTDQSEIKADSGSPNRPIIEKKPISATKGADAYREQIEEE
jgi:hypothetical protein